MTMQSNQQTALQGAQHEINHRQQIDNRSITDRSYIKVRKRLASDLHCYSFWGVYQTFKIRLLRIRKSTF